MCISVNLKSCAPLSGACTLNEKLTEINKMELEINQPGTNLCYNTFIACWSIPSINVNMNLKTIISNIVIKSRQILANIFTNALYKS